MLHQISYEEPKPPTSDDRAALSLLAAVHSIFGGLGTLGSLGIWLANRNDPIIPAMAILYGSWSALQLACGLCMRCRRHRLYSLIFASIYCLLFPIGTFIGVWTLRVLCKPGVNKLYLERKDVPVPVPC